MPHRGFKATSFPRALFAMAFAVSIAYYGRVLPTVPVSDGTPRKCDRNADIRARHQQGESVATLADVFGISEQRVSQILRGQRK
jgi:Mor family transcriptional regulator